MRTFYVQGLQTHKGILKLQQKYNDDIILSDYKQLFRGIFMSKAIIIISFYLIYYHISGLATTNIIRLTKGNNTSVLSSKCYCDNCGSKIPPILQLPIISYLIRKGKCRNCGVKIPMYPLILEFVVLMGMCTMTSLLKFTFWGVTVSYLFYEAVRITLILIKGKREKEFAKQYIIALFSMLPFYLLTLVVALIYKIA